MIGCKIGVVNPNRVHNRMNKSLDNLKLGAIARKKGKVRVTVTILPETKAWLQSSGNMSERIDEVVRRILAGELIKKPE